MRCVKPRKMERLVAPEQWVLLRLHGLQECQWCVKPVSFFPFPHTCMCPHLQLLSAPCFSLRTAVCIPHSLTPSTPKYTSFCLLDTDCTEASPAISCPSASPWAQERCCIHPTSQRAELRCPPRSHTRVMVSLVVCLNTTVLELSNPSGGREGEHVV